MNIATLRKQYHQQICNQIIRIKRKGKKEYPNFADGDSKSSVEFSKNLLNELGCKPAYGSIQGQSVGNFFEDITKVFLENSFALLSNIRPGKWHYATDKTAISGFEQYEHLAELSEKVENDQTLASVLGVGYIVKPDIIIARYSISDQELNQNTLVLEEESSLAELTPLRSKNRKSGLGNMILHASVSCKWTIRSDRSQNTRTEALNLIRNRKGHLPHIVAVTAEPLPMRIVTLALGTGDIDCVYHFALPELKTAIEKANNHDQLEMLMMMIEGRRLRDISDLPFDLAI